MKIAWSNSEMPAGMRRIEPLLNATGIFIMGTFYLYWVGSRAAYVLLSLAACAFIVRYRPQMPRDHRLYSWPIYGFIGAAVLSLLANGIPDGGWNFITSRYFLLLLAVPLVSVFYLSFNPRRNVWFKFAVGCMVIGVLAVVDIFMLGEERASAGHNSAAFGFNALAMTTVLLASWYRFREARYGKAIYFLALAMGLCAMILSSARSAWIAGLVVLVITLFMSLDRYSFTRRALVALALVGVLAAAASSIPVVQKRTVDMVNMIMPYVEDEKPGKFTSLRFRVEAWKLGLRAGLQHKVFGFGPGNTKSVIDEYAEDHRKMKRVAQLNHLHNQFVQSFAMTGLVGLFSVLALLTCHFWLFARYLRKHYSVAVRALALSGLLLVVAYLVKCFPGVPFYGKKYLLMYGFASASIWGCLLGALRHSEPAAVNPAPADRADR